MKNTILVYKVVSHKYSSMFETDMPLSTTYSIGVTKTNVNQPYFAFKSFGDALKFTYNHDGIIYECQAIKSKYQPLYRSYCYDTVDKKLEFWKCVRNKKKVNVSKTSVVKGTIFCSEITPIKIV